MTYSIGSDTFDILQASNANNPNFIFNLAAGNWYVIEFYGAAGLSYQSQVHGCSGCAVGSGPQAPGFKPHVGDNYAVYNPPSGSPCTFAGSGNIAVSSPLNLGTLNFSNACTLTGIGGYIDYTGTGAVSPGNQLYIANYAGTDTQYTTPLNIRNVSLNGFRYDLLDLGLSGTYLIQAWYDSNGNGGSGPTAGEPITQLGSFTVGTVNALNIILSNANTEPGSVTPTPAATATLTVTPTATITGTPTITFTPNPSNTATSTPTITGTFICTVVETAVPVTISTSADSFGTAANVGPLNALSDLVVAGQTTASGSGGEYFQFTANFTGPVSFYVDCFDDGSGTHLDAMVVYNSSQAYLTQTSGVSAVQGSLFYVTSGQSYYALVLAEIGSEPGGTYKAHLIGQPVPTSTYTPTITSTPNLSNTPTSTGTYVCTVVETSTPVAIPPTASGFSTAVSLGALNLSSDIVVSGQINENSNFMEYFSFIPSYSGTVSCYVDCYESESGINQFTAYFYNSGQVYLSEASGGYGSPVETGSINVTAGQTYYGEAFATTGAGSYKVHLIANTPPTPTFTPTITATPTWTSSPTFTPTYVCTVVEASAPVTITLLNSSVARAYDAGTLSDGNDLVVWGQNIPGQDEYFKFTANSSVTLTTYLDCFDSGNGSHLYQAAYYNASPTPTFISEDPGGTGPVEGPGYLPVTAGQTYYGVIQDSAGAGAFKAHVIAPAPSWHPVGSYGFSSGAATDTSLAVYNGVPYVAFMDGSNNNDATVMKYTGVGTTGWQTLGNADFSSAAVTSVSLAFDGSGNAYVAFQNVSDTNAYVWECSGCGANTGTWTQSVSTSQSAYAPSLAIGGGNLYLAFNAFDNNKNVWVIENTGSGWANLGTGTDLNTQDDPASGAQIGTAMAVNSSGYPFVGFLQGDGYPIVSGWNGSGWGYVTGTEPPLTTPYGIASMAIAGTNTYLAYQYGSSDLAVAACLGCGVNTGSWSATLGNLGNGLNIYAYAPSLSTDNNGNPYVAFEGLNDDKANVLGYSGGVWTYMGSSDFSSGPAGFPSMAFSGPTPYIVFEDGANNNQATVMTYY